MINRKNFLRVTVLSVWLLFFILNTAIVFILYDWQWIHRNTFIDALKVINLAYAPYLGAILIFYWSNSKNKNPRSSIGVGMILMIVTSLLWNISITFLLLPLLRGEALIQDQLESIDSIITIFSWLVSGAFGFYFARN